jgi:hypothetical protein
MNWYKKAQKEEHTFYHGTDSPPFTEYQPEKASKGEQHYNPLGEALYVTDKEDFAKMFGKNVYEVKVPKDAKIKRVKPSSAESAIRDIIMRSIKKSGIDYWGDTDIGFKVQLGRILESARYSPYEAIIEAVALIDISYPNLNDFAKNVSDIATKKFAKYDVVMFTGTNNPNDIFVGETPTQEILIFNKEFQKVFQR